MFTLQIINGNMYYAYVNSFTNNQSAYKQKPVRGNFFDTNNNQLTFNDIYFEIYIDYFKTNYLIKTLSIEKIVDDILESFKLDPEIVLKALQRSIQTQKNILLTTVTQEYLINLTGHIDFSKLPIIFREIHIRKYAYPYVFTHVIGYVGKVSEEILKNDKFYYVDDYVGVYKLEKDLEKYLRGTKFEFDINNIDYKALPGASVYLNINKDWQLSLYNILSHEVSRYNAASGSVIIMENNTGKIRAIVSYDGINENEFVIGISTEKYNNIATKRSLPFIDKAISSGAEPGSTFKLITSYALLENNVIDVNYHFFSNRCMNISAHQEFCEYNRYFYGDMNIIRAIYKSSNIFFCNAMITRGSIEQLIASASLFNIGKLVGIDLSGEFSGVLDSPSNRILQNSRWYDGDTCNISIGQGSLLVTPLQMLMVVSAISNNGKYFQPYVIDKIVDFQNNILLKNEPKIIKEIPSNNNAFSIINQALQQSVQNPEAWMYTLHDLPNNVKGKTGTAEAFEIINGNRIKTTHGWVIGTFEYNNISYAFVVHIKHGIHGSNAIYVIQKFIDCLNKNFGINCS
ncbi:MAG: penicillin-binding transpeptidase domain-containing protein [Candidatus Dojkabacteria bacterium]|nr:penicillin-binding transpeptidase domain-containing protein [Candidatus Dojkabacteria bacterium]